MTNTSSSPVVVRIQQSSLIFVVLLLALGALLLTATNIAPGAGKRAGVQFVSWKSPDGFIELQRPSEWSPVANPSNTSFSYFFQSASSPNAPTTLPVSLALVVSRTDALKIKDITATSSPDEILKLLGKMQPQGTPSLNSRPVQAGPYKGFALHDTHQVANSAQGAQAATPATADDDIWILAIDPTHVLIIDLTTPTASWPSVQPIFEQMLGTLRVNRDGLLQAVEALATPSATGQATQGATQAGTESATESAAATMQATQAATP
ncbi:MAG: hypothetical protein ABI947_09135 [Chloroflexota bacterium]